MSSVGVGLFSQTQYRCRSLVSIEKGAAWQGGLVALWMTNRERHWRFVEGELLPHWGLRPAAAWLWLKVTDSGEPVAPLVRPPPPSQPLLTALSTWRIRTTVRGSQSDTSSL